MTDRTRQSEIIPLQIAQDMHATVVGVGAVGRPLVHNLASIGIGRITVIDFDLVEEVNVALQGYLPEDIGKPKVEAVREAIQREFDDVEIEALFRRFDAELVRSPICLTPVDSIDVRRQIWHGVKRRCQLLVDTRMKGEVLQVIAVTPLTDKDYYPRTLFSNREADPGRCTARGTRYVATIAASLATYQVARWLRNQPLNRDTMLDLATMSFVRDVWSDDNESTSEPESNHVQQRA